MSVVGKCFLLSGECIGRVVHECFLRAFYAEAFEKPGGECGEVNHGHTFTLGNFFHCCGIVAVGVVEFTVFVEMTAGCRGEEHWFEACCACTVDKGLEVVREVVVCTAAGRLVFLVVVSEFDEDPVAGFCHRKHFLKAFGSHE